MAVKYDRLLRFVLFFHLEMRTVSFIMEVSRIFSVDILSSLLNDRK